MWDFNCKDYVWESVKTQAYIEDQVDFERNSQEANLQSSHMLSTWLECEESWQPEVFASVSQVRPSREILAKHSIWLFCHVFFTKSLPTLYIPSLTTYYKECFLEKKP